MTREITVRIFDEVKCAFYGLDKDVIEQLIEDYSLFVDGYRFIAKYQIGLWDGKKQFFTKNGATYIFLLPKIVKKLKKWGYKNIRYIDERSSPFHEICPSTIEDDYFSHIINKKSNTPYTLTDHQLEAAKTMVEHGGGIALAGTGFGKAQPLYCKILTPDGWTTMGDIKKGDLVFTPKNTITRVLDTFNQGVTRVYKVSFEDGGETFCHSGHLWKIYNTRWYANDKEPYSLYTTKQIIDNMKKTKNSFYVPSIPVPINFRKHEYYIDPYLAGSILPFVELKNDKLVITEQSASTHRHSQILLEDAIDAYTPYGISLKIRNMATVGDDDVNGILTATDDYSQKLLDVVKDFIVNNKTIPDHYIHCAQEDRLRFLQGMCDVGGMISVNGQINVLVFHSQLRKQIMEMILLQGGTLDPLNNRPHYNKKYGITVYFSHTKPDNFFTIMDKKKHFYLYCSDNLETISKISKNRKIVSIDYHGMDETKCILLEDPDHLYITDDCIITHNTILNAVLVDSYAKKGCKTLTIVPAKTLIKQTVEQFETLGLDVTHYNSGNPSLDHDHIVTTWQTLQNVPHVMSQFQMVVVDECLDGETLISMADYSHKTIKDIVIGDKVLSYNDGHYEIDEVLKLHHNLLKSNNEKMYRLEFDNGVLLEVTGNHMIMTENGYVRADDLDDENVIGL
jgi:hypothetical protein